MGVSTDSLIYTSRMHDTKMAYRNTGSQISPLGREQVSPEQNEAKNHCGKYPGGSLVHRPICIE